MARLITPRSVQYPLVSEFIFNFDDTMVDITGALVDFGKTNLGPTTVVIAALPPGAVLQNGAIISNIAFDTLGFDVSVGTADDLDRYLLTTDKKDPGHTHIELSGYVHQAGQNITFTFALDDVCTQGRATIRIEYTVVGRANEVQIT